MEHKYIDADTLIERVERNDDLPWNLDKVSQIAIISILRHAPAVDMEPIVHGTWEYADWPLKSSNRFCSVCGRAEKIYAHNRDDFKYCRCGAKMDGGSE